MAKDEKKVSQAQRKATDKYLEKFDEIRIRVPKGQKATMQAQAAAAGKSLNAFIIEAIDEKLRRAGAQGITD